MNSAFEQTTALIREEETISYSLGRGERNKLHHFFSRNWQNASNDSSGSIKRLSLFHCSSIQSEDLVRVQFFRYDTTVTDISNLSFQEIRTHHPEPHIIKTNVAAFWHLPTQCNGILRYAFRCMNHVITTSDGRERERQRGS
jgi:hypothetical protein